MLILVAVAAGGLLAGIAVAGLPDAVPDDVASSEIEPRPPTTTTPVLRTTAVTTSTTFAAESSTPEAATTAPVTPPSSSPPRSVQPTSTTTTLVPIETLRVVVANAGWADLLAARTADLLRSLGYNDVIATTGLERRLLSDVLYATGREVEAQRLANQLGIPATRVQPHPGVAVSVGNEQGDVWLLVGNDRLQQFQGTGGG
jgi:hypothetical protein